MIERQEELRRSRVPERGVTIDHLHSLAQLRETFGPGRYRSSTLGFPVDGKVVLGVLPGSLPG